MRRARDWLIAVLATLMLAAAGRGADEEELIRQYNAAISSLNGGKYEQARKELDGFEKLAKEVKAGDAAFERAQVLLKRVPELRATSFHNSAVTAKNAASKAVLAGKLDEAARQLAQFIRDTTELAKLRPTEATYKEQLAAGQRELAQVEVVRDLLAAKPFDAKKQEAAAAEEPKLLFHSAPAFALPRVGPPQWTSPLTEPGTVVVAQVFAAADETAHFAIQTAAALHRQFSSRSVHVVSISIDEGEGLARLDEFVANHQPTWPVLLDDRADFYSQYIQGGFRLPAYVVVGRDRRAYWLNGKGPLETTAMLAAKLSHELAKPADGLPAGPVDDFPPAVPFSATRVRDAAPVTLAFGDKPALVAMCLEPDDGPHFAELAALDERYGSQLRLLAVVRTDRFSQARELAAKHPAEFYQIRWGLPDCYGPNFRTKLALVSRGGRVLKTLPLGSDAAHVRAVLSRYAALLSAAGAYPAAADAVASNNLAGRLAGGTIEVSSSRQQGSRQRLNDGVTGSQGWSPRDMLPQDVTISLIDARPATFDRLSLERRAGLGEFEVLAADSAAGPFRSLGKFIADERAGRQAFALPRTEAGVIKLRLLSTVGGRDAKVEIGEVELLESADVQPPLARRLAARIGDGRFADDFSRPGLALWEQTDFVFGLGHAEWLTNQGRLEVRGLAPIPELRATALLHATPPPDDFHLRAVVRSRGNQAGGLLFGFRDWDNFLRLLLVQGHVQTGRSEGNSIRLERWNEGRLEVLGVHGEAFPHTQPLRLEVLRQGTRLAVKAQDKVLFALDDVPAAPGRVGICAAGGGEFQVEEIDVAALSSTDRWNVQPLPPLSTPAGATLVWLNSQGDDQHPDSWASHLLRNPVFASPAAWQAVRVGQELPEAVFAFGNHAEVAIEGVEFELPLRAGMEARDLVHKAEVLVSRGSPLDAESFRSLGQFTLVPKAGPQTFALAAPAACRYLKLRLLENGGGDRFALARFGVRLGAPLAFEAAATASDRTKMEEQFEIAADDSEVEPNDDAAAATPLRNAKTLEAAIHFGQTDSFRVPPPPPGNGLKTLRLTIDALPWLRLKAAVCDAAGTPVGPPLAQFHSGQHAEQTRQLAAGASPPALVRVEMPPASLALVLDTSGSMSGREEDVRAAVKSYLAGAAVSEQIEVIEFNSDVWVIGRLPDDGPKVDAAVKKLSVRGNTALYQALLKAMENNQAIILLSDGMNTVFKADFTEFCRRLGRRPLPIYVIGIGVDLFEYDANSGNTAFHLLENLARQTGGRFYFLPESQQLEALYQQIAAEVRGQTRYRLRAEWEVSQRTVELAGVGRTVAIRRGTLALPLPPAEPELVLGSSVQGARVPKAAGMPPAEVSLAPPTPPGAAAKPLAVRLPSSGAAELASLPATLTRGPRQAPFPPLVELKVAYTPPKPSDPALPAAVLPAFELIFDSSESMKELLAGQAKIEVARKVMNDLADALPADVQVGLRLYGHWGTWIARKTDPQAGQVPWTDERLNTDSELVVPIGPLTARQRAELKRWINWTQPRGKTPMVYSLLQAQKDFSPNWRGPRTLILVSDGVETCGGKLEDLAKAFQGAGINAVIHVVGFDIAGTNAEKQLRQIAKIGGGEYYGAKDARQLAAALKAAAAAGAFAMYDEGGALVARGMVNGDPVAVLPGKYRVRLAQVKADALELEIPVTSGPTLRLELGKDGSLKQP